jgi:hypothetical protein
VEVEEGAFEELRAAAARVPEVKPLVLVVGVYPLTGLR